jgi:hypothetical protein
VLPKQEPVSTPEPVIQPAYPLEQVEQAHAEAIQSERERADARLAEYQAQVEAQLKTHLASEAQRQPEMTAAVQRQLEKLQTGREREREAAKNIQTHLTNQLRELRAVAAQGTQPNSQGTQPNSQGKQPNSKSDPATQDAGRATLRPESDGVIKRDANMRCEGPGVKNADELFAAQLQATLQGITWAKAKNDAAVKAKADTVKPEPSVKSEPNVKTETSSGKTAVGESSPAPGGKSPPRRPPSTNKGGAAQPEPKKSSAGKDKSKRSRQRDDPPDSDPSDDDDDDEGDSSDSSDSSDFENAGPSIVTQKAADGTPMFTINPFVSANSLPDFDEKTDPSDRAHWLEKFQATAMAGGWTDKVKLYQFKLNLPSSVRNWRSSLRPEIRSNWKKFLRAFKANYCKDTSSTHAERYYMASQRKTETPREFYYRLIRAANRADIDFTSSKKLRDRHGKFFIKKLTDSRLRTTLQGQRIRR